MVYRHKVGLTKSLNQKISTLFVTLLVLMSPIFTAGSILAPAKTNATAITSHVVINEIFPSPSSGSEWIELYNPTASTVDLTGWKIKDSAIYETILSGTITAKSFVIVNVDNFNNTGDTAHLINNSDSEVDTVGYSVPINSNYSYARIYDADSLFEERSSANVTQGTTNGTEPYSYNVNHSSFLSTNKYVRSDSPVGNSSYIKVPGATTSVRFHYDGAVDFNNMEGYEHIQTGHWPSAQGNKQFRIKFALPAGKYDVTAEYQADGTWYPVTGSAVVYSINLPWATHVIPSVTRQYFRTLDNPVRVHVDDQFKQFKHMITEINGVKFAVLRSQCDLRQEGKYLFCDVDKATAQTINSVNYPAWIPLVESAYTAKTTTFTKANNRKDDIVSLPFTIDATRPVLTNFVITTPEPIYGNSIDVTADATDSNGIEYVKYYISEPRTLDGQCDGNGTQQRIEISNIGSGSTYSATFDTSGLNGEYCLNALAKDNSSHTSSPILRIKVTIDTTLDLKDDQPVIVITAPPTESQQSGTPTPPVTTLFQNFAPAFINDGVVTPVPTTETLVTEVADNADGEVLGAQDTFANEAANFAGANTKSGISKGLLWLLIASGAIGTIIAWFLLARRRQGTE